MKKKIFFRNPIHAIIIVLLGLATVQCDVKPDEPFVTRDQMQIMEYIQSDSLKQFTEFDTISKRVGMSGILSTRGPFTLFLPDNQAFLDYYKSKGKNSFSDFTDEELTMIIRNHVVAAKITTNNIGLGSLSEKNALEDFLVSEFIESETKGSDIIINKESKIIKRDIEVANGVIHRVDKVIDPVVNGVFSTIKEQNVFSIFTKALEASGLSDTLDIYSIPYGKSTARVRYTILAVPDSVFNANGIFSVDDLISKFDDGVGSITDVNNGFYKYVEYHCVENTFYLSGIETGSYYLISRNNAISIQVGSQFLIDVAKGDSIKTTFIEKYSNIPSKNGVIHCIDQLMPAREPVAKEYRFDTTAFPEFQELDIYGIDGTRNFYDNEFGIANIKWTGDYLQYWCKHQGTGFINEDCIVMPESYWTLEVTTPKIARGKYLVSGYFKSGGNRANVIFYIDGVKVDKVVQLNGISDVFPTVELTEVDFTVTKEHVIRVVTVYPGVIMWDRLVFTPIE